MRFFGVVHSALLSIFASGLPVRIEGKISRKIPGESPMAEAVWVGL
jgi:hypothetical protein